MDEQFISLFASFAFYQRDGTLASEESNTPRNVAEIIYQLYQSDEGGKVEKSISCMKRELEILSRGPNGSSKFNIGNASFCINCGFVGLPKNFENYDPFSSNNSQKYGHCKDCESSDHTYAIRLIQFDGTTVTWIETTESLPSL
jgi:hypothetical protein